MTFVLPYPDGKMMAPSDNTKRRMDDSMVACAISIILLRPSFETNQGKHRRIRDLLQRSNVGMGCLVGMGAKCPATCCSMLLLVLLSTAGPEIVFLSFSLAEGR
jgi:hypothetical protein